MTRNNMIRYLIDEYYNGSVVDAAADTGYTSSQIEQWLAGDVKPNRSTVEYFVHTLFTPQFRVVIEFADFDPHKAVLTQLKELLAGHEERAGIYAFYDSMGSLLYIGKATCLLTEAYEAIRREVHIPFPAGIKNKPTRRSEIVRYISAYDVGSSNWLDYPRHVESLILRISKPPLNKNIGCLERAYADAEGSTA